MASIKEGRIVLVERNYNLMETNVFESRKELILRLVKSGDTFGCDQSTYQHFQGIDDLIKDIKKIKSNMKSEMVARHDYPKQFNDE